MKYTLGLFNDTACFEYSVKFMKAMIYEVNARFTCIRRQAEAVIEEASSGKDTTKSKLPRSGTRLPVVFASYVIALRLPLALRTV